MDWFDRGILQFVLAWAPYGGPRDADVFPQFGMTADELVARFNRIVATQIKHVGHLEDSDRLLLARAVAHLRRTTSAGAHQEACT